MPGKPRVIIPDSDRRLAVSYNGSVSPRRRRPPTQPQSSAHQMTAPAQNHLSQLSTRWSLVRRVHAADAATRRMALAELLAIYEPAIRGYLGRMVRDPHAADELYQEFAVRLCRGDFHAADPQRGQFRALVAAAVRNLTRDHFSRRPTGCLSDGVVPAVADPPPELEEEFLTLYRQRLFGEALDLLAVDRHPQARVWAAALRLAFADPDAPDAVLADRLAAEAGPLSPAQFRKRLWEARRAYTRYLVHAVAETLSDPTAAALADELLVLGVLAPCRAAVDEWVGGRGGW